MCTLIERLNSTFYTEGVADHIRSRMCKSNVRYCSIADIAKISIVRVPRTFAKAANRYVERAVIRTSPKGQNISSVPLSRSNVAFRDTISKKRPYLPNSNSFS